MSEEKRFASGSGRDRDDALDQMLAGMAGEVPPVPEEFRRAWRQAVRQEAAAEARRSAGPSSGYPSGTAAAQPETRKTADGSISGNRIRRFPRILTAAAMVLFLAGGAMLARPSLFVPPRKDVSSAAVESPADRETVKSTPDPSPVMIPADPRPSAAGPEKDQAAGYDAAREAEEVSSAASGTAYETAGAPAAGSDMLSGFDMLYEETEEAPAAAYNAEAVPDAVADAVCETETSAAAAYKAEAVPDAVADTVCEAETSAAAAAFGRKEAPAEKNAAAVPETENGPAADSVPLSVQSSSHGRPNGTETADSGADAGLMDSSAEPAAGPDRTQPVLPRILGGALIAVSLILLLYARGKAADRRSP